MQLFGRGLRRRFPTMFDGDPQRIRMAYSLLFSLPGTPVLFYGEEIGMGENLDDRGRMSVRTPMQWNDEKNGGFSKARPSRLRRPVVEGRFGPMAVNVGGATSGPRVTLELDGTGDPPPPRDTRARVGNVGGHRNRCPSVFAHRCDWEGRRVVAAHNLA